MPSLNSARPLIKLISLGLAGLLAGLLTGCEASSSKAVSADVETYMADPQGNDPPASLDARQIPGLHHPPSARRLDEGAVHLTHAALTTGRHS